jgi:endonuclease G
MVRISNCVWINDQVTAFAQALNYLVNVAGVSVINLSMGIFPRHLNGEAWTALNDAYQKGVIVVCAAGNHIDPVVSPAFNGRTIAVGGVTSNDQVWSGTSFGTTVDWAAPSADIRRAVVKGKKFGFANGGDGTSYAAALTTGVAALWLNHHATLLNQYPELWQRVEAFKTLGKLTSRKPGNWKSDVVGDGILNAFNLISAPLPNANSLIQEAAL